MLSVKLNSLIQASEAWSRALLWVSATPAVSVLRKPR